MTERILVVDDEVVLRNNLVRFLARSGHDAEGAGTAEQALSLLESNDFAVVLTDLRMPGMGGGALLAEIARRYPETRVLVMTAYGSVQTAVDALRHGASDYLLKPLSLEDVARKVATLLEHRNLAQQVYRMRQQLHQQHDSATMVADAPAMAPVMRLLNKAAGSRSTVLVEGESGTGKELVARALHERAPWADKEFIAVNLAAQPTELVDATLFGHQRGAYTGATRSRDGVFRAARGGTVFLDEIGELPPAVQVKLLRVLENREVQPLGADRPEKVDFRLVVASNRPLRGLVEAGTFREDLLFRIEVLRIDLPPLRDRTSDIPALVARLLDRHARQQGCAAPQVTNDAMRALQSYRWPGNIRELSNVIERAVLMADGEWVTPNDLPSAMTASEATDPLDLKQAVAAFERKHIGRILTRTQGDKRAAADLLGVHLATLYRHLERLGVQ
jgi:DNA-binding NtrC family response regulator